ncbi:MAG: hypothetical protein ACREC4_02190, partial [Methylocella sp.]
PESRRQTSQARSCRWRPKAPHLRKYRSCQTTTMDRKNSRNRPALERFPITWNHVIEKESLKFKELEHALVEKVEQLFRDML